MPNPRMKITRIVGHAPEQDRVATIASSRSGAKTGPGQAPHDGQDQGETEDEHLGDQEDLDVEPEPVEDLRQRFHEDGSVEERAA